MLNAGELIDGHRLIHYASGAMLSWEYNRACFFALEENGPKRIKITYDGRVFFGHQQLGRFPSLRTFEKGEGMTFALPDVHARRPPMLPQTVALPDLR